MTTYNNSTQMPIHEDYKNTIDAVCQVRDCVEGSNKVKHERTRYLPHPSQVDTTSDEALKRYSDYLLNAEFDSDTDDTRRELLGKMRIGDTQTELPGKINYLISNIDGDGTTIQGAIENVTDNILQTKYHILVADYKGLSGVELESISVTEAQEINPRATIKQYTRESLINWYFSRVNGALQLTFAMLLERGTSFNPDSYVQDEVNSYLILALDENNEYYQQKIVFGGNGTGQYSERDYPTVNDQRLNFIPISIVADEEIQPGTIPKSLGYLYGVSEKVLQRYRTSATYKEVQKALLPTTYTSGWLQGDSDLFEELNGRKGIESGPYSVNALPNEVKVSVESTQSDMDDFHWYFDQSRKQVSEMGGKSGSSASNMTATEADIVATSQNALLNTLADSVERAFEEQLAYCAMFEGLVMPDNVNSYDQVVVTMPRDFATPKMSVEEVGKLFEAYQLGVRTREQVVRVMANGGWDSQDAETTLAELENDAVVNLPVVDGD